jgi:hypothetical protein
LNLRNRIHIRLCFNAAFDAVPVADVTVLSVGCEWQHLLTVSELMKKNILYSDNWLRYKFDIGVVKYSVLRRTSLNGLLVCIVLSSTV